MDAGNFTDDSNSKPLSAEDQKVYDNWEFVNLKSYEEEIVEFLYFEERVVRCVRVCYVLVHSGTTCITIVGCLCLCGGRYVDLPCICHLYCDGNH